MPHGFHNLPISWRKDDARGDQPAPP